MRCTAITASHSSSVMFASTLIFSVLLLPLPFALGERFLPDTAHGWLVLLVLALSAQALGQSLIAYALAHLPATFGSVGLYLQVIAAAMYAWLLLLASFFMDRFSRQFGKEITGVAQTTMDLLCRYDWPGNVRELQNVIERAVVLSRGPILRLSTDLLPIKGCAEELETDSGDAGLEPVADPSYYASLEQIERNHILRVLGRTGGVIDGERGAAKILDINPNTLRSRMKKLGVERPI